MLILAGGGLSENCRTSRSAWPPPGYSVNISRSTPSAFDKVAGEIRPTRLANRTRAALLMLPRDQRLSITILGLTYGSKMPTGGCEVQAEQPSNPPAYPVRFKPLLERSRPAPESPTRG